jgi:hypothetical protein
MNAIRRHCILTRLEQLRPLLQYQGTVQRKQTGDRTTFQVRWREAVPGDGTEGRYVRRSLGLGRDPEFAAEVRDLLAAWQSEHDLRRSRVPEVQEYCRMITELGQQLPRSTRTRWKRHHLRVGLAPAAILEAVTTWVPRRACGRGKSGAMRWIVPPVGPMGA